jgi:two-component system response regulator RegA
MTDERATLLLVEDDTTLRERLAVAFARRGYAVTSAGTVAEALGAARADPPELAVVDLKLPDGSGLDVVRALRALDGATRVVVLTGYGSIATAVEAVRLGAADYVPKPATADAVLAALHRGEETGAPPLTVPSLARVEWEHIQRVMDQCKGNVSHAAELLGIHRRSLQRKLAKNPVRR